MIYTVDSPDIVTVSVKSDNGTHNFKLSETIDLSNFVLEIAEIYELIEINIDPVDELLRGGERPNKEFRTLVLYITELLKIHNEAINELAVENK